MDQQTQEAINTIVYALSSIGLAVTRMAERDLDPSVSRDLHSFAEAISALTAQMRVINGQ